MSVDADAVTPSTVFGKVVFWLVFVITFTMFTSASGVPPISGFLDQLPRHRRTPFEIHGIRPDVPHFVVSWTGGTIGSDQGGTRNGGSRWGT